MGVVSRMWVWVESMGVVVRRYIYRFTPTTPLISAFLQHPYLLFIKKIFLFLLRSFFVIYVIIFSRSISTHTGIPPKPYEGLHITRKHTQTNVSYPVMDISCTPSRAGCRSRSRGRAL